MVEKFDPLLLPPRPDLSFETSLWNADLHWVAGIDEAGRGALAGPVAAAAIILPPDPNLFYVLSGVRDSKQMTPSQRQYWAERLLAIALSAAVGFASSQEIDNLGILPATQKAICRALAQLVPQPQHLLVDYIDFPSCPFPHTLLVKGDARSLSIAAASILAKTARDALMCQLDADYPDYGFAQHKGYGTLSHRCSISRLGFTPLHRRSFRFRLP